MMASRRAMVLWCPDWPVTAVVRSRGLPADAPIALIEKGAVFACSAAARGEGVARGQRVREAQARCTDLVVVPYEAAVDHRAFEPVLAALENLTPGVQLLRPGMCAIGARGPARYYGGERAAALAIAGVLDDLGIADTRIGIADGPFTAECAARDARGSRVTVVPEGESAAFLAPLPVSVLGDPALAGLLARLGILTLDGFAELAADDVEGRFGVAGARLHALAAGLDSRPVTPRVVPKEFDVAVDFEPALDRVDQVAFGFRTSADDFVEQLVGAKLVCTAIVVEIETESGAFSERSWLHPRSFTAADVLDRIRWQLQGAGANESGLDSGITRVRVVPEAVDAIGNHEVGLWGGGTDERVHHGLSRVQSMLGHGAVLTAVIGGGRTLVERRTLVAWGDRPVGVSGEQLPWPGHLPTPAPATVFETPVAASMVARDGSDVGIDERGALTAVPARFAVGNGQLTAIAAWAGPWAVEERWWDAEHARRSHRFQVVDGSGAAWLFVLEHHGPERQTWMAEGRYD